jgi:hypothetical protein
MTQHLVNGWKVGRVGGLFCHMKGGYVMHAQYLEVVKTLIQTSPEFNNCEVETYIEPSISSTIFYICADGYNHIFKAPFGLLETKLTATALAEIIVDEVLEWRDKINTV